MANPGAAKDANELEALVAPVLVRHTLRRTLPSASCVLSALLVLCVTVELTVGFRAYSELLASRDPGRRWMVSHEGFAQLWADGFGGYLPRLLDLAHVAGYALLFTVGLVAVAAARVWQAAEGGRGEVNLIARLPRTLARAQLQQNNRWEKTQADMADNARWLRAPVAALGTSAAQLNAAGGRMETTVKELTSAVTLLSDEARDRLATEAGGLAAAGGEFADRIGAAGLAAAREIGAVYQEAVAVAAGDLEEKMTLVGQQLAISVGEIRAAAQTLGASAQDVTVAVSRLCDLVARQGLGGGVNGSEDTRVKGS